MRRLITLLTLALIAVPVLSAAQDKKEPAPRSLADEAAYLTENSGKAGWVAHDVALTRDGGTEKHTGQLSIAFAARNGTSGGLVTLRWRAGKMNGAVGNMAFELVENDGKRFINAWDAARKEVVLALEYSVATDLLTIKGAVSKAWTSIFDDEPTKVVGFKPADEKAKLPTGPAPRFFTVTEIGRDNIKFTEVAIKDGRRVAFDYVPALAQTEIYDASGKKISAEECLKRVKVGTVVLVAAEDAKPDPAYLAVLKEDAVVLVPGGVLADGQPVKLEK